MNNLENMNKKEIETYIIKNTNYNITGTQLAFITDGFLLAIKKLKESSQKVKK